MKKFCIEGKGKWCKIITPCVVSAIPQRSNPNCFERFASESAQWDTGATISLISQRLVQELHLKHIRYTTISGFENKPVKARTYLVNLTFPNSLEVKYVEVAEAPLLLVDLLVGMDVIADGDLHYSVNNGLSRFEFSVE